jgi:hypothetical protein
LVQWTAVAHSLRNTDDASNAIGHMS